MLFIVLRLYFLLPILSMASYALPLPVQVEFFFSCNQLTNQNSVNCQGAAPTTKISLNYYSTEYYLIMLND